MLDDEIGRKCADFLTRAVMWFAWRDALCVESHLRELLEQGFEIAVVQDATAAAKVPEGDGYLAALINFRFIANAVWTTDEAVERLGG